MNAKTRGDMSGLFDDLPEPEPADSACDKCVGLARRACRAIQGVPGTLGLKPKTVGAILTRRAR